MKINRRGALGLAGAATLSATIGTAAGAAESSAVSFRHGVASGDPRQDRVILWTRVTPDQADAGAVDVDWEIAEDPDFKGSVRRGTARTSAARDFTVKVDVTGLRPLTRYHYRFRCGGQTSPVGQTQTLPEGKVKDMVIAVASCALYSTGFFNAYKEMAKLERVDLMLHLGDYIYEYGGAPDQLGMSIGQKIGRVPTPLNEAVTLADYRERHSCYRLDPDLQAAHARAPWICIWDDHETANDCWTGGAQNHQPEEGDWIERRAASIRAYYEWIPIREPEQGRGFEEINRTFELGDLATLVMLENRHIGRSRQISLRDPQDAHWLVVDKTDPARPVPVTDAAIVKDVLTAARTGKPIPAPYGIKLDTEALKKRIEDPSRSVLGDAQEKWLRAQLETSVRAGKPWQILGNQVVMARTTGVDVVAAMGKDGWEKALAQMTPYLRPWVRQLADLPRDIPFEFDGWDAYPAARARMDAILVESGARPLILSGDSHAFWMNALNGAGRRCIAAEIGTTAITSSSLGNMLGNVELGPAFADACEEVLFNQHLTKGFALVTLSAEEAKVDLIGVTTVLSRDYKRFTLKSYRILPGEGGGIKSIDEV